MKIEHQVNTAMGKAIDSATKLLNDRVKEATDIAVIGINESAGKLISSVEKTKKEIEKVSNAFRRKRITAEHNMCLTHP